MPQAGGPARCGHPADLSAPRRSFALLPFVHGAAFAPRHEPLCGPFCRSTPAAKGRDRPRPAIRGTSGCCAAVLRSCRSCTRAAFRPLVGRLSVDNATGIVDQPRLPRFKAWTNYYNYVGVGTYRLRQRSRRTATRRMLRRRGRDRRAESWPSPVRRRVVTSDGRGDSDDPDSRPSGTPAGLAPLQIEDAPVRWGNRACLTLSASRRNPPRVA